MCQVREREIGSWYTVAAENCFLPPLVWPSPCPDFEIAQASTLSTFLSPKRHLGAMALTRSLQPFALAAPKHTMAVQHLHF